VRVALDQQDGPRVLGRAPFETRDDCREPRRRLVVRDERVGLHREHHAGGVARIRSCAPNFGGISYRREATE
jgi:hypothetical protein